MKRLLLLLLALLVGRSMQAQSTTSYASRLPLEIVNVPTYNFVPSARQPYILRMDFASPRVNQAASWMESQKFKQIDLVFTLYPKQPADWRVGYDSLMERRFRMVESPCCC